MSFFLLIHSEYGERRGRGGIFGGRKEKRFDSNWNDKFVVAANGGKTTRRERNQRSIIVCLLISLAQAGTRFVSATSIAKLISAGRVSRKIARFAVESRGRGGKTHYPNRMGATRHARQVTSN